MFTLYVYLVTTIALPGLPFAGRAYYSLQECEAARDEADRLWGQFKRETGLMIKFKFYCE